MQKAEWEILAKVLEPHKKKEKGKREFGYHPGMLSCPKESA